MDNTDTTIQARTVSDHLPAILTGVLVFLLLAILSIYNDVYTSKHDFHIHARNISHHVEDRARNAEAMLVALSGKLQSQGKLNESRFVTFSYNLLKVYPEINGVIYMPLVHISQLPSYLDRTRRGYLPDYRITELTDKSTLIKVNKRSFYLPVHIMLPNRKSTRKYIGLDIMSHPQLGADMIRNMSVNKLFASRPTDFLSGDRSIIVFKPVNYEAGSTLPGKGQLNSLSGVVGVFLSPANLVPTGKLDLHVQLSVLPSEEIIYRSHSDSEKSMLDFSYSTSISILDSKYHLSITRPFSPAILSVSNLVIVAIFSLLVAMLSGSMLKKLRVSRKASESHRLELEDTMHRYKLATLSGQVGVWDWDVASGYVYIDPNLKLMLGYRDDEIPNRLDSLQAHIHPHDLKKVYHAAEEHLRANSNEYNIEHRAIHKDGSIHWILTRGHAIRNREGRATRMIGTCSDITAMKNIELTLKSERDLLNVYMETTDTIILVLSAAGHISLINRQGLKTLGYLESELVGKNWFNTCMPASNRDKMLEIFHNIIRTNSDDEVRDIQATILTRHGEERLISWHNHANRDDHGEITSLICSGKDITDIEREKTEKERLHRQLQHSQKMESIGQLTGGIAHDFNNILASILGYTELAIENTPDTNNQKYRDYLRQVHVAGKRARELVAQLLSFSRGSKSTPVSLGVNPVIRESLSILQSTLPSSIKLDVDIDATENINVMLDQTQLGQIILNLCINARDAMEGNGRLSISTAVDTTSKTECSSCHNNIHGHHLKIMVSDTGQGIEPVLASRLFEPFFTTKPAGKGSGMGLSMVHGITHEYNGHITLDSEPGKGTTFTLYFPVSEEVELEIPSAMDTNIVELRASPAHILVVDDEESVAYFIEDFLESRGFTSTTEVDSLRALEAFRGDPEAFDAVITDQTMPGMTGIELLKEIKAIRPDIPVIICSGYTDAVDHDSAISAGASDFLAKPLDSGRLVSRIAELTAHARAS